MERPLQTECSEVELMLLKRVMLAEARLTLLERKQNG